MIEIPTLVGSAVRLRPMTHDDAAALANASAEDRGSYSHTSVPDGLQGASDYITTALEQAATGWRLPLVTEFEGRVVGSTSFLAPEIWTWGSGSAHQRDGVPDVCEIGATWLAASAQRTSCNTEAKLLMLRHAFDEWRVHRVSLRTDARNDRSRGAIERLGARFEGVRRADLPGTDDTVRDSAYYSLLADEWPDARRALEKRLS
ncbi:MAG: GNAT family protein [Actinomycetota bacterium]